MRLRSSDVRDDDGYADGSESGLPVITSDYSDAAADNDRLRGHVTVLL